MDESTLPRVPIRFARCRADARGAARGGCGRAPGAVRDPSARRLSVVYANVRPELLQHGAQAIVRGVLAEDGVFHADEVLLKCPTRYGEELPNQVEGS